MVGFGDQHQRVKLFVASMPKSEAPVQISKLRKMGANNLNIPWGPGLVRHSWFVKNTQNVREVVVAIYLTMNHESNGKKTHTHTQKKKQTNMYVLTTHGTHGQGSYHWPKKSPSEVI